MYMQHGIPRLCFQYPTKAEYLRLCSQGRPTLEDFGAQQMLLHTPSSGTAYAARYAGVARLSDQDDSAGSDSDLAINFPEGDLTLDDPCELKGTDLAPSPGARKLTFKEVQQWHRQLAHPGAVRLYSTLVVNGLNTTQAVKGEDAKNCEVCQKGKAFQRGRIPGSLPPKDPKIDGFNNRVSFDLLHVLEVKTTGAKWFACTVTDLYSRYLQIYFIQGKKGGPILRLFRSCWVGRFSIPSGL